VPDYFPAHCRGGALGWSLGIGRTGAIAGPLIVGILMDNDLSYRWSFYLFAGCALTGALVMCVVPSAASIEAALPVGASDPGTIALPSQSPQR
jgi:AAHS family benzoate transporter-like MFS transporter